VSSSGAQLLAVTHLFEREIVCSFAIGEKGEWPAEKMGRTTCMESTWLVALIQVPLAYSLSFYKTYR
jgi:hypothetical protein